MMNYIRVEELRPLFDERLPRVSVCECRDERFVYRMKTTDAKVEGQRRYVRNPFEPFCAGMALLIRQENVGQTVSRDSGG